MEGDFNPSSDGVNIFIPTDLLLEIKEQGENGKERERLLFSSLAPHLSKIWLKSLHVPPNQHWLVESFCNYMLCRV